ncbi:TonB-dependent receptor [Aquabacterium sp. OR-4]|uniref:TonB-dependent receptor n=1 Tax=Aquabacterium sp. OR-4 TaxID=2978127 RepID=UPI0021B24AEF|nr:TonB-dependent receptor [Aquabacterium sp. OR-4]MDT7838486.1 TonB-dependent receptor [Aquabacterium sp. OR-4]
MRQSLPSRPLRLSLLIHAICCLPALAGAQTASTTPPAAATAATASTTATAGPDAASAQSVTVTGIRAAMRSALQNKENATGQVEVIAAEDIGKLPDTTIAESLARLPGLAAGVDRGNASQVVARGLGPRFIGATLNGREFATTEPDRAVRFEMFPSESISGATVYKTQQADIVEGGIATTIDLQTVSPLAHSARAASLKADAVYYQLSSQIDGAKKVAPRLGGIYIDQFANRTLGLAIAFSHYDQPSVEDSLRNWGFNENNNDPALGKESWGFQHKVKRGTNTRSSVLAKLEARPGADWLLSADLYHARSKIDEPELYHTADTGNWNGWRSGSFSQVQRDNGYITGATLAGASVNTIQGLWQQDMRNLAGGLNAKWKRGAWSLEADVASSRADRDTLWSAVALNLPASGALSWNFARDQWMNYSFSQDTGNPAGYAGAISETWGPTYSGRLKDELDSQLLTLSRKVDGSPLSKLSVGLRATQREKGYEQVSWNYGSNASITAADLSRVQVDGRPDFVALQGDFRAAVARLFGASALSAAGRSATDSDLRDRNWRAAERNLALFVQGDFSGQLGGLGWRGNAGLRVVQTEQTGYGMSWLPGASTLTAVSDGLKHTRALPSANWVLSLDERDVNQLRLGLARAMSRAPLDVMSAAQTIWIDNSGPQPVARISGGNPRLKPMMADQIDLTFQRFFAKGGLLSAGLFYKKVSDYIGMSSVAGTWGGQQAFFTQQINAGKGHVSGLELVYQQAFSTLPEPWNGLGVFANYTYTRSSIQENGDASGASFRPIATNGLMKDNGGLTLWYERQGFEARLAVNHHSAYNRAPTWDSTRFQINGAETWVSLNLSQKLTDQWQLRFGVENLGNQTVTYTDPLNPVNQENFRFGRRINVGVSYKL